MKSNKDLLDLEKNDITKNDINSKFLLNSPNSLDNNSTRAKPNFTRIESSVLSRVKDFLPKLKEANNELKKKMDNNEDVNIENIKEGDEYIQMNLALGILEQKEELNENNIKINPNANKNKSIVELNSNNNINKTEGEKEKEILNCTDNNNNNNNILEILNQPTSVLDNFILNSDESDEENGENEVLEPIEVNY
ncbi:hypothetical protein DICPUDRAFT_147960 [Dictyostelium purpureum]|uniref:Uncharacterized protein n=1 Tax=Dictyostelium purpureum TaxID=5786 RepID=F0Z9V7_DICPU|nr:uncharacterized protein DICPUDRAFT_147960 [Dictyostelium purpureum]EGC39307.1 hypothetical protein DICPUDRAFT_147960 [Dictyostelium purpureum]|eukprot:XP_003284211.1 hypothetical protein DICPUDRAFT_147960 [Dictyostelium purpureum]